MKIIDRIIIFIKHKNLSMREFDTSINVGNGYISKQSKSSASVGSDVLERIIDTYPDLSPLWLLTGKGTIIIEVVDKKNTDDTKNTNKANETPFIYNTFDEIIESKIECIVARQLKTFGDKLENIPTLEKISDEIQKSFNKN